MRMCYDKAMQRYRVTLSAPAKHLVDVQYTFDPQSASAEVLVQMPAWCPGSYLIRDYPRFVRQLVARDGAGQSLAVRKVDKSTWSIAVPANGSIVVSYTVYGHDLTVRTNHIDDSHAFLHGPATFLYCPALRNESVDVHIVGPENPSQPWHVCCGLAFGNPALTASGITLHAASIDELLDMPMHLGPTRRAHLPCSTHVELVLWGPRVPGGQFSEDSLVTDLAAIVNAHVARLGEAPFEHYSFVLMLTHDGYGGLEHRNSSINIFASNFTATRKIYEDLLELLSHEFFHAWNGKRIAPAPLLNFDYQREAYTPCLWVMEGITSHYDRWALLGAGLITDKSFLLKVLDDWSRLKSIPGRALASLEQSSFDAWIKLYKPDESNLNTTVSYYLKGGLAIVALDLELRRRSNGTVSFDDILRALWSEYGRPAIAHPDDLQPLFERVSGLDLSDWFNQIVRGTADPQLSRELQHVGLALREVIDPSTIADGATPGWLGITMSGNRITAVFDGSAAQLAGLSPGDEVIALDGFRVSSEADVRTYCSNQAPDTNIDVALFRRQVLLHCHVTLAQPAVTKFEIVASSDCEPAAAERYHSWIGAAHVQGTVMATVVTTGRSA
jgi:predicted metalloprotease with PDZ domain